jgi:hypothetical protein
LIACKIPGWFISCEKPRIPRVENQISIIGPKELPTKFVPNCYIKKMIPIISNTIGTTGIEGL